VRALATSGMRLTVWSTNALLAETLSRIPGVVAIRTPPSLSMRPSALAPWVAMLEKGAKFQCRVLKDVTDRAANPAPDEVTI
jgi:hypothetical protein